MDSCKYACNMLACHERGDGARSAGSGHSLDAGSLPAHSCCDRRSFETFCADSCARTSSVPGRRRLLQRASPPTPESSEVYVLPTAYVQPQPGERETFILAPSVHGVAHGSLFHFQAPKSLLQMQIPM